MGSKEEFRFRNVHLPERSFKFFAELRSQNKFCDTEVTIGEQRISAHRVILAASIPLFQRVDLDEEEILMPDIDASVFQCLVDYAYSYELKITMENVKTLLSGACLMRMKEVQDACCDFLIGRMHPDFVFDYRELAGSLNLPQLKEFIDLYIKENFEEVSKTEKFLCSPFTYVRELFSKDDLNVDGEEKVLESVMRWVKASVSERKDKLPELLQQVRMVLLKPLYLTDFLEREQYIQMSLKCRDLVDEARNYNLFPERRRQKCTFSAKPRQLMKIYEGTQVTDNRPYFLEAEVKYTVLELDVMGASCQMKCSERFWLNAGSVAELNKKIYFLDRSYLYEYDIETKKSQLFDHLTVPRYFTAAVSLRNKVFICGGTTNRPTAASIVECFDPAKKEWSEVSSLQTARCGLSAVSLGDYIYAIGGLDRCHIYDTVERYSFVLKKWQFMKSMITPRYSAGAAVLNGKIYVCGGTLRIFGRKCTATAEVYDPFTNQWKSISPMISARTKLKLFGFSGNLYAVGGDEADGKYLDSSEVYDPQSDKWRHGLGSVASTRFSAAVVM